MNQTTQSNRTRAGRTAGRGLFALFAAATAAVSLLAAGPAWWATRGVTGTNVPNDFAPATAGQLKWVAAQARAELDEKLSGGAGTGVAAVVGAFLNSNNLAPVTLWQLKYVAEPFYARLLATSIVGVTSRPWTATTADDADFAPANLGQLKTVFAFDLDTDNDGLPDWWETTNFGGLSQTAVGDVDVDGLSNLAEYHAGCNPNSSDTDGDLFTDGYEVAHGTDPLSVVSAPPLRIQIDDGDYYVVSTNIVVHFDGMVADGVFVGDGSPLQLQTSQPFATSVPYQLQDGTNGVHTVFAQLLRGTNWSRRFGASVALDTTPPAMTISSPSGGASTNRSWVWVSGTVTDEVGTVAVYVNERRADINIDGHFEIDRVALTNGSNMVVVMAVDAAGNAVTQAVAVVLDASGDIVAPIVGVCLPYDEYVTNGVTNIASVTTLPASETLYLEGWMDDETALAVIESVGVEDGVTNSGSVMDIGTQVWMRVSLAPGTNLVRFRATDAAGNTGEVVRTVIRDESFIFEITNPVPYQTLNDFAVVAKGRASASFLNATITVNGVSCSISNCGDHVEFATVTPVPLESVLTSLNGRADLGGRSYFCDPPGGFYETLSWNARSRYHYADRWKNGTCAGDDIAHGWSDDRYGWNADDGMYWWQGSYYDYERTCGHVNTGSGQPSDESYQPYWPADNFYQVYFGDWNQVRYSPPGYPFYYAYSSWAHDENTVSFRKTGPGREVQCVILQFLNLNYGRSPGEPIVPSNITFWGQSGIWYNGNVAFVVPIEVGRKYTIGPSDFTWPGYAYPEYPDADSSFLYSGHWLSFDGITNDVNNVIVDTSRDTVSERVASRLRNVFLVNERPVKFKGPINDHLVTPRRAGGALFVRPERLTSTGGYSWQLEKVSGETQSGVDNQLTTPVAGHPEIARISTDGWGHYNLKLMTGPPTSQSLKEVDVWVVWSEFEDRTPAAFGPVEVLSQDSVEIRVGVDSLGSLNKRTAYFIMKPESLIGGGLNADVPDLFSPKNPPSAAPPINGTSWNGYPLRDGAKFRLDASRRLRKSVGYSSGIPANVLAVMTNSAFYLNIGVAYPADPLIGNDDWHQDDEGIDSAAHALTLTDATTLSVGDQLSVSSGETFEVSVDFEDFVRLNLAKKWHLVSDPEAGAWAVRYRFKQSTGGRWRDNGSEYLP